MGVNDKSSQSDFLISIAGIDGLWSTLTGGLAQIQQTEDYDGGATEPDLEMGMKTYTDVVIARGYRALRDAPLAKNLRPKQGVWVTTATKQPTDKAKVKVGVDPTVYSVVLKTVADPDTDSKSAATGMLMLTFGCNGVK